MVQIQHFAYPFTLDVSTKHVGVNEQGTIDDVVSCIATAFLTQPGTRVEVPTFGVPEQLFELQPLHLETLVAAVAEWEPRADVVMTQVMDTNTPMNVRLAAVATLQSSNG